MKEEDFLKEHFGQQDPFKVPKGYFDQTTQHVMEQVKQRSQKKYRMIWAYAAAAVVTLLLGLNLFTTSEPTEDYTAEQEYILSELSDDDFYSLIAEENSSDIILFEREEFDTSNF